MASCEQGYEDERFENAVSQNFHCPICLNVFKDPLMCPRNQHCFCRPCITRHLENSQTCPSCMEKLTLNTLRQAPRIALGYLSELNIRCDYFSRGCREFVRLEKLESHVKDCGFAPVVCSNEGCLVEINKRDRAHHEAEVCEVRKVKCHNCAEMTKMMEDIKMNFMATKDKLDQMEQGLTAVTDKFHEMEELKQRVDQLSTSDEIRDIKSKQDEMMTEIRRKQHDATNAKPNLVVAGGLDAYCIPLRSVEVFNWSTRLWSRLQPMKECRWRASSFVYKSQITVTGGFIVAEATNTVEQVNIGPVLDHSAQWRHFPAKLPGRLSGHKTVVYNERVIVIGGNDEDMKDFSRNIHEIQLHPPYATKLLARMPQPRAFHGAELFNDKIFILGGSKTATCNSNVDSVLVYDINKNKCQQMGSLPISVGDMASVKWGDNIILLGGEDENGKTLNTVIIYNIKTGKSYMLPEMKCKRAGCTAVVSGNSIVVVGGYDEKNNVLKSVECFKFDNYSWENLSPMNEKRRWHTAMT